MDTQLPTGTAAYRVYCGNGGIGALPLHIARLSDCDVGRFNRLVDAAAEERLWLVGVLVVRWSS